MHGEAKVTKQHFYATRLPALKPTGEHRIISKHRLPRPSKRDGSNFLPPIAGDNSLETALPHVPLVLPANNLEASSSSLAYNSAVHEAAKRLILRNNMAKFSHDFPSMPAINGFSSKRKTLYNHVQAKVDTGLIRACGINLQESPTCQLEPVRPVNWSALRNEIEQDIHICAQTKRMQFTAGNLHETQITVLGNLVRSKVKSYLSNLAGDGDDRYKIVVHLTIFQTTIAGLHVASRCLWDAQTDNSITIKMQGDDCNILIVVFLCYTAIGGI